MSINRNELVQKIADKLDGDVSKGDVDKVIGGFADVLTEAVSQGDSVSIQGLMSVETVERAARQGRNPRTGESIEIAATTGVSIKAGSKLKAAAKG
ncbi:HU family DNA-binding protein [Pseudokineococcus marinus]|uniref:Integration host factor n=1 Tax=Pseudokineococcus marinus TaxID=351215 RepID=A0A849BU43_9ACTN|nr:HU family DNA-binding protein [Pseudokineococcus marinus]NNH23944.1 integration host factor [Pseudokineococcus marinus]